MFILEALICGLLPVKLPQCRKNANVLGIANAFAGGVFIAIALLHILPEAAEGWEEHNHEHDDDLPKHGDGDDPWPMPYFLVFVGYSAILLIDKVVFDTHALVGHDGHDHVHHSFANLEAKQQNGAQINTSDVEEGIKEYISRADRFATRMSVAMGRPISANRTFVKPSAHQQLLDDQAHHFVDKDQISIDEEADNDFG